LAKHRDSRCKASIETLHQALIGTYQPEHVVELTQALQLYDFYQTQIAACDERLEQTLQDLQADAEPPTAPMPAPRHKTKQPNELGFDVRAALYAMLGVDLTQIHGLGPYVALKLVAECGTDMTRWPSAKHFASWLALSPGNKVSGGKVLSSRTRRSSSRAAAALRRSAVTVGRTDTALGAFYRRLAGRIGKPKPSPPPPVRSPCSSTTRCATAWGTRTRGRTTTRSAIASACSPISVVELSPWAISSSRWKPSQQEFLRKAAAFFANESN
jgi:transposase